MSAQRVGDASPLGYMMQLDGLRAAAVTMVFFGHWVPARYQLGLPWGFLGVELFFVLSGFLITGILLRCRQTRSASRRERFTEIRIFYVRRFLRIFPIFYALLLVLFALDVGPVRKTVLWHVSYLSNIYFSSRGEWQGRISHFWSLAVEEQFYLIWPWVVVLCPSRHLLKAILTFVALAPCFRLCLLFFHVPLLSIQLLPVSSFDSLGYGALLALWDWNHGQAGAGVPKVWARHSSWFGGLGFFLLSGLALKGTTLPAAVFGTTLLALFLGWIVQRASTGFGWPLSVVLEDRRVVYLGRISYGFYLFHNLMPVVYAGALSMSAEAPRWDVLYVRIPALFLMTTAAASLSWHFFERPINHLKRFIPYGR